MKDKKLYAIFKNMIETRRYLLIIILGCFIITAIPITIQKIIVPSFKNQIINNIQDEAKRVATHLFNTIKDENLDYNAIDTFVKQEITEFKISGIHYFDQTGYLIYSSNKYDLLDINNSLSFHNIDDKNKVHYNIQHNSDIFLKEKNSLFDIIKIYIPTVKNGKFQSAFELYYDFTKEEKEFKTLAKKILTTNIILSILLIIILFTLVFFASKSNLQIKQYQQKLKDLANNDSLTNLYNRRYFNNVANNLLDITIRNKENISVAMIDIDNFKKINDTYGHQCGDLVIKALAKMLKNLTRNSDIIARYEGEEFVILFPNTDLAGTRIISDKICKSVEELTVVSKGQEIHFTISIGISQHLENQTIEDIIDTADKALYIAKTNGRNRVVKL